MVAGAGRDGGGVAAGTGGGEMGVVDTEPGPADAASNPAYRSGGAAGRWDGLALGCRDGAVAASAARVSRLSANAPTAAPKIVGTA